MLKNMKISTLLIIAFSIICVSASTITLTSFFGFQFLKKDFRELKENTWPLTIMANKINGNINLIARAIRNIALTEDKDTIELERKRIVTSTAEIDGVIGKFNSLSQNDKEKQLISAIVDAKNKYGAVQAEALNKITEGRKKELITFLVEKVRPVQAAYFKAVDDFLEYQNSRMESSAGTVESTVGTMQTTIVSLAILGTVLALVIAFFTIRIITRALNKAVIIANRVGEGDFTVKIEVDSNNELGQLNASLKSMIERLKATIADIKLTSQRLTEDSRELNSSAEQISNAIQEQSEKSSQIATASEEMSQTTIDIAKSSSNIAANATNASNTAKEGEIIVSRSVNEVKTIDLKVSESAGLIKSLGDRSKQIGNIVEVIKDIADQTNLLALNAAIEAARAGEQGRGFAVVADEVRMLAERTTGATSEISGMIQSIQGEVDKAVLSTDYATKQVVVGVDLSTRAGSALQGIVGSVSGLHQMVEQIASATEEMSQVSDQISRDIGSIALSSKGILSRSEQISQSSSDLADLSARLHGVASQFSV